MLSSKGGGTRELRAGIASAIVVYLRELGKDKLKHQIPRVLNELLKLLLASEGVGEILQVITFGAYIFSKT